MSDPLRLGVVRVYRDEDWPSMDLVADQLLAYLPRTHDIVATDIAPPFRRVFGSLPFVGSRRAAFNADRLINRYHRLLKNLRRLRGEHDWFHIADHSYAMAAHALPPGRVGVFCHDLDAFRCVLEPDRDPRPWWFRKISQRILDGLRSAAVVFHSTRAVREQLLHFGLVPEERLVAAPYGVSEGYTPGPSNAAHEPFLLHVGSAIPRKRLDLLLDVFAGVRMQFPELRLVQIGGTWTHAMEEQIARLGLANAIEQRRGLTRSELANYYRGALLVMVTSEAEGFGLPVIEALACGAPVLASDLPVLREVGSEAVMYRAVGDIPSWVEAAKCVLDDAAVAPPRELRLHQASLYTWQAHARTIGETYLRLEQIRRSSGAAP